jgi:hypothetical protein
MRSRHSGSLEGLRGLSGPIPVRSSCAGLGALVLACVSGPARGHQATVVVEVAPGLVLPLLASIVLLLITVLIYGRAKVPASTETRPGFSTQGEEGTLGEPMGTSPSAASLPSRGSAPTSPTSTDSSTQTGRPWPPKPPPPEAIEEVWVSGSGERFHINRDCSGLRNAQTLFRKTRCQVCGIRPG